MPTSVLEDTYPSAIEKNRKIFFRIVLLFGMFGSLAIPIINSFLHANNESAPIDIFAFFLFLFLFGLSGIQKVKRLSYWIISLFSCAAVIGINFQTPTNFTIQNVSLLVVIPIITIFFLGKRSGIFLSIAYLLVLLYFLTLHSDPATTFIILFDVCIAIVILAFYQHAQDKTQEELADSINQLLDQKKQLEDMNKMMIDRELTMIELKKRIETLKNK